MKNLKRNDEELKFIGLDGFSEIESIFPETKKQPVSHTAKTKKSKSGKLSLSVFSDKLKASKKLPEHKHTAPAERNRFVYKKRVVLSVAAGVTAVMLSLVTVAGALDGGKDPITAVIAESDIPGSQNTTLPLLNASTLDEAGSRVKAAKARSLYALYVDGEIIGVVEDGEALKAALDQFLAEVKAGFDDQTTTEFVNDVEVSPYKGELKAQSVDSLMETAQWMCSVKLRTDSSYTEETAYDTEITEDDSLPLGYEEITQEGQNGVTEYSVRLTYVDGVKTDTEITGSNVLSYPVTEKKTVGTKEETYSYEESNDSYSDYSYGSSGSSTGYSASTGGFMWPVPHTTNITSYMEYRWGRMHNGIDIAGGGDYGMPFVASAGGTVIFAGNDGGGYGNYVMIDHGNGYVTVYGHASELCCSVGQQVSQGETIGLIGSTGNSTGPHLHFEVRLNGEYQNPLNYV